MPTPRRERQRAETLREIHQLALEQVATDGVQGLSLNKIARLMGLSGPALYRYVASRDELVTDLVVAGYDGLTAAVAEAAESTRRRRPPARLHAVAAAYRNWALANPHHYRLVFGDPHGSGLIAADRVIPASHRAMHVLIDLLATFPLRPEPVPATLRRQLTTWAGARAGDPIDPVVLLTGLRLWTRIHGIVSLELEGGFHSMGIDAGLLLAAELEALSPAADDPS